MVIPLSLYCHAPQRNTSWLCRLCSYLPIPLRFLPSMLLLYRLPRVPTTWFTPHFCTLIIPRPFHLLAEVKTTRTP